MRRPPIWRMGVVLLLVSGVVFGYGSAIVHGLHGGGWGAHCSHASAPAETPTPP